MRIAIGALLCEGNSITPVKTRYEDFDYASGMAMLKKVPIADMLESEHCEVIPTIYAHALPGGPIIKGDFLRLAAEIVDPIPTSDLDGVWLYLHGATWVEDIGSAEEYILKKIRGKIGFQIPISVAMDFHADNSDAFVSMCNVICGYRTAPHTDREFAQRNALRLLFQCINEKILPCPKISRANVVICGDAVLTSEEPLASIMKAADEMEKTIPGMMSVQVFNGQPWIDAPFMGPNFVVTHKTDVVKAQECADELARMFYDVRHDFKFKIEAVSPEEALHRANEAKETTVFVSDSGDNTTAGAPGDNAFFINRVKSMNLDSVLIAGIMDKAACDCCYEAGVGGHVTVQVGGSLSSESESSEIEGVVEHLGNVFGYNHADAGPSATLNCGKFTVVITENRASICRPDIFESINLDYHKYHIVIVKLGYLFPELAADAERSILAFSPGASTERLEDMHLKNIRRPMYPLDDDFL